MKIIKNISVLFLSLVLLLTSSGFIIEQYFCSGCHQEHNEVAFFEFGEISHEHQACQNCTQHSETCTCQQDDHLKNTKISYFSLDQLFFKIVTQGHAKITIIKIFNQFDIFNFVIIKDFGHTYPLKSLIKIPPLIATDAGSAIFGAVISVFRL